MCGPAAFIGISLALTAASTYAQYEAASSAADAQEEANKSLMGFRNKQTLNEVQFQKMQNALQQERYTRVGKEALDSANDQFSAVKDNLRQQQNSQFQQLSGVIDGIRSSEGSTRAAMAESGTEGRTKEAMLQDFEALEGMNIVNTGINIENSAKQAYRQMLGIQTTAQNQANSATPQTLQPIAPPPPMAPVVGPSPGAYLLQFGAQAASTLAGYYAASSSAPNVSTWTGSASSAAAPVGSYGAAAPVYGQMPYVPTYI
jgi:hypothetical protein